MRPRSLRARLALWHAGILALTLLTLDVLTLFLLRRYLTTRADDVLLDFADTTARMIATDLYQSSLSGRTPPQHLLSGVNSWKGTIQVVDSYGRIVDRLDASKTIPPDLTARIDGQKGHVYWQTRLDLEEHPVRVVTVPVMMGDQIPYLVMAAASLEGIDEALQRTVLILSVLTPTVFVISLFGGWLLVGRSLRPVYEMTRTALAIEHTNLDRRIEPPSADDEISRLASAFNEMIARLDKSFRQIQQFSADASHELKTPLTSMRGAAEVALMKELRPDEYRAALRSIVDDVERMSAIVDNLLLLARADAQQIEIRRQRVALHEVVMETFEQMEPIARRKQVSLDMKDIEEAEVEGDPLWISQIITNLLNNAIKYTPAGGRVAIAVTSSHECSSNPFERSDSSDMSDHKALSITGTQSLTLPSAREARVSITDTGPGIPAEHLPHIFDRFYRVDSGRSRDAGGVGLGLNIALWSAEAHGGRIDVASEEGHGSTFTLVLPLAGTLLDR